MLIKSVEIGFPWRVFQVPVLLFHFWRSQFFLSLIAEEKNTLLSVLW